MKLLRNIMIMAIFSMGLSALLYYKNSDVIKTASWVDEIGEIATVGLFIFIFTFVLYLIARTVVKGARTVAKKKPSDAEGPGR
ncbi:hypothetical protein [uncultured Flavobacterium sp.]|uniref:hypothetical protein n=1 Tax=uncultured Flavobacterium sp. TaxID=165435 RepID=UPI0025E8F352|nr:hypothetical protein [uncultured Flavobacterium sp.]